MTIKIKTGHAGVADFLGYLDTFDDEFTAAGRGVFSNGLSGDYAGAEAEITDTATSEAQAYVLRGNISYSLATHTVSGTVRAIEFGHGATATGTGALEIGLEATDYLVRLTPSVGDPESEALINGILGSGVGARSDELVNLLKQDAIVFKGSAGDDVFAGYRFDDRLVGNRGRDDLNGRGGEDTLIGGAGRDTLTGGKGKDDFVFVGNFGRDVVTDFTVGRDDLDLSRLEGEASSVREFKDASTERNGRVVYDMGDDGKNMIVLLDISLDDLSGRDFIF